MSIHVPVRELDLRRADLLLDTGSVADRMNALPGFKTSAAFFTFLRANLVLPPTSTQSAMSSNASTPLLNAASSQTLPPPSPAQLSSGNPAPTSPPPDRFTQIPELTTGVFSGRDRVDGLNLIADSIAQQRQTASRALIFSPIFAAVWIAMVAAVAQLMWRERGDLGLAFCTIGGLTMAMLVLCRGLTGGYLAQAETISWAFLDNTEQGGEDILIGTKFGTEVIGVLALRLERGGSSKKKKTGKGGKALVRAWTVILRYRHKGIGTGLLEEAVKMSREALGRDVEIGFAVDHANSTMILPELFNGVFRRSEKNAIAMLESVVAGTDLAGKKK